MTDNYKYKGPVKTALTLYNRYVRGGRLVVRLAMYLFLSIVSFVFLFPFLYMIITSLKSPYDLYDATVNWIPRSFFVANYATAFSKLGYLPHFFISLFLTGAGIFTHIFVGSFVAYGLARYKFPGKTLLFGIVVLSIVVPTQVLILPQYIEFVALGWKDTYLPLLVPLFFGFGLRGGVFIFLFRLFFLGLPKSLEEAAKIDGCGYLGVYWRIALPTAKTSVLVCAVLALVWHWNEYFESAIYLSSQELWPLPSMLPGVYRLFEQTFRGAGSGGLSGVGAAAGSLSSMVSEGTVMAATFLVIAPVLVAYFFLQKRFMEGIERSGLVE